MRNQWILASALALVYLAGMALAGDFPQWRGPGRDGKVVGWEAPAAWPKEFSMKWRVEVGLGDSSPALVGDKVFAFGRMGDDEVITCIGAADGKVLWQEKHPAGFAPMGPSKAHPGPRATPTVSEGKVVTLGVGGIATCWNAADGKVIWRKESTKDYMENPYLGETSASPVVVDGVVVLAVGVKNASEIFGIDLATGDVKWSWKSETEATTSGSPVLAEIEGKKQVVTVTNKNLIGLDPADGKVLWKAPFAANGGNNLSPIVSGSVVIMGGQQAGTSAFKISRDGDKFAATKLWNTELSPRFTTPVLHAGFLYGFDGAFYCLNAETGAVMWKDATKRGNSAAIVDGGNVLMATTIQGDFVVFEPSEKKYSEVAKFKVAVTETWAHPLVSGKRVIVRDKEGVTAWAME